MGFKMGLGRGSLADSCGLGNRWASRAVYYECCHSVMQQVNRSTAAPPAAAELVSFKPYFGQAARPRPELSEAIGIDVGTTPRA